MSYVIHDSQRWHIRRKTRIDGEPAYILQQPRPGRAPRVILARASECEPWQAPPERLRVFSDGKHILEIRTGSDGSVREMKVRQARSSKRFETGLGAIYRLTISAHAFKNSKRRRRRI